MDSPPGFPRFPKLSSELRLRIWKYAFPVLSTPSEEIIVIIDRNIQFLTTPPSTFPTQIVFSYDLSALFAPCAPPPINREVNDEFRRRYPVVLDLLPDIHSPVPAVQDTTTARQIIRFNPSKDKIFIEPPSLYALFNIVQSPPSLSTLARFVGFDQILHLSTPLEQRIINGLRFLTRWLFTGLPPTGTGNFSSSSDALTDPHAALTSQTRSITTNLTYDSQSDLFHARKQALAVSPPIRPDDTEAAQNLLRTTRVILVQVPIDEDLDVEMMLLFRAWEEKLGEEDLLERSEYSLLSKAAVDLMDGMEEELGGFFEVK